LSVCPSYRSGQFRHVHQLGLATEPTPWSLAEPGSQPSVWCRPSQAPSEASERVITHASQRAPTDPQQPRIESLCTTSRHEICPRHVDPLYYIPAPRPTPLDPIPETPGLKKEKRSCSTQSHVPRKKDGKEGVLDVRARETPLSHRHTHTRNPCLTALVFFASRLDGSTLVLLAPLTVLR